MRSTRQRERTYSDQLVMPLHYERHPPEGERVLAAADAFEGEIDVVAREAPDKDIEAALRGELPRGHADDHGRDPVLPDGREPSRVSGTTSRCSGSRRRLAVDGVRRA
jgi:hypothetical protein